MAMQFRGLVRAFDQARTQLQSGIKPGEINQFREQVESIVQSVEEICGKHRITPDQLPTPSRRVYRFLKELDTNNMPPRVMMPPLTATWIQGQERRRVNAVYFRAHMPKPNLVWNRILTRRKFGHYQPSRDTMMLSVSMDDSKVPAFVVDFIMYQELLHKKHGHNR